MHGWKTTLALASLSALAILAPATALAQAAAGQSAVIINYQRFGDDRYPQTSVSAKQFEMQIAMLSGGRYSVVHAGEIVDTLYAGKLLANRTVAITFDDAYRSAYDIAWPRLRKARLPFTLFVSTDAIDEGGPAFMTWDQIRELKAAGATIGAHGAAHLHLPEATPEEVAADIERSIRRIEEETGERPVLFSYPHGEMTPAVRDAVAAAGFKAAFGQHSGAVGEFLDRYMLPRFSINDRYGSQAEFGRRLEALGLPFRDVVPGSPVIGGETPPTITFSLDESVGRARKLLCFHSTAGDEFVEVPLAEASDRRYEIRFQNAFPPGSWRVNCTMPTGGKRYRWWGMQFYTPR